ncbi:MAG: nuclear transport factor 2 family protein [Flavobacteriaceae bacterium]|nr:nuclear transport factor 2 family protein [Flavobacteriaceae bacterium]
MKKLILLLFIPLVSFGQVSYDDTMSIKSISAKDSLAIMKVMEFQENAWNSGDINSFMEGYIKSDELVFSGKSGPVYGWNETRNRYLKNYPDTQTMGQLKFSVNKIRSVSSDVAFLIGEYYLTRSTEDSYGHFTLFWKKINNKWLIISDHTSAAK